MKPKLNALANKIKNVGVVKYQAAPAKNQSTLSDDQYNKMVSDLKKPKVKKAPIVPAMKQYGDKGYKPSTGKGVGY